MLHKQMNIQGHLMPYTHVHTCTHMLCTYSNYYLLNMTQDLDLVRYMTAHEDKDNMLWMPSENTVISKHNNYVYVKMPKVLHVVDNLTKQT